MEVHWQQIWKWGYRVACGLGTPEPQNQSTMYGEYGDFFIRCCWLDDKNERAILSIHVPNTERTSVFFAKDRYVPLTRWQAFWSQSTGHIFIGVETYRPGRWIKHVEMLAASVSDEQFERGRAMALKQIDFLDIDDSHMFTEDGEIIDET